MQNDDTSWFSLVTPSPSPTIKFNEQQRAAIYAPFDGHQIVIAIPGAGKTAALTHRVAHMIQSGVDPSSSVICTYTRTAAEEMCERLVPLIGDIANDRQRLFVGTLHSLGFKILKDYGGKHGWEVIKEYEAKRVIEDQLGFRGLNWKIGYRYPLKWINEAKIAGVSWQEAQQSQWFTTQLVSVGTPRWQAITFGGNLATIYEAYERDKEKNHKIDFDDMLFLTHRLLVREDTRDASILAQIRARWPYGIYDEFQDTTVQQFDIISAINANVFVVGDGDQQLFSFAGSNSDVNIFGFKNRFPDAMILPFEVNFRSTRAIVQVADRLIGHNYQGREDRQQYRKIMRSAETAQDGAPVEAHFFPDQEEQAEWVGEQIQARLKRGFLPRDFFVIYRTNAQSRAVEEALLTRGIIYIVEGGRGFYARKVITDVLGYLRLIKDRANDEAFRRVSNIASASHSTHFRGFGKAFIETDCQGEDAASLWEGMLKASKRRSFKPFQQKGVDDFVQLLSQLDAVRKKTHEHGETAALVKAVRDLCYDAYLIRSEGATDEDNAETGDYWDDLDELVTAAKGFPTLDAFLAHVDDTLTKQKKRGRDEKEAVTLLSIHKAKGRERKICFVIGASEGLLPHARAITNYIDFAQPLPNRGSIEDERCAAFVAITRAKEETVVCGIRLYRNKELEPSRFITEMGIPLISHLPVEEEDDAEEMRASAHEVTAEQLALPPPVSTEVVTEATLEISEEVPF